MSAGVVCPAATATPAAASTPAAAAPAAAAPKTFEDNWRKAVHDGFIAGSALPAKTLAASTGFLAQVQPKAGSGDVEIAIMPDPSVYDGRFANNGWMQELPNPITKITWDNVALISPATAANALLA